MIQFQPDFKTTVAFDGSFRRLAPGGHICCILGARVGNEQIKDRLVERLTLQLEITEGGEFDGYFNDIFVERRKKDPKAKWPVSGLFRQDTRDRKTGGTNPWFKGLLAAIADSNPDFTLDENAAALDEKRLVGKCVGIIFQEREYRSEETGRKQIAVDPVAFRPVNVIRAGVPVPEMKRLEEPAQGAAEQTGYVGGAAEGFASVPEEEMPF